MAREGVLKARTDLNKLDAESCLWVKEPWTQNDTVIDSSSGKLQEKKSPKILNPFSESMS